MKNYKLLTKECHNCGYVIVQDTRAWDGRPDKNDENMQLTNCPFCNNPFIDGVVIDYYGYFPNLKKKVYEEHIKNNPEKEKLYNERINGKPIRTPKELAERERAKAARQKRVQEYKKTINSNLPKCPICGSTDLKKLDVLNRGFSAFMWGLGSNKIGKTYECRKCKATF